MTYEKTHIFKIQIYFFFYFLELFNKLNQENERGNKSKGVKFVPHLYSRHTHIKHTHTHAFRQIKNQIYMSHLTSNLILSFCTFRLLLTYHYTHDLDVNMYVSERKGNDATRIFADTFIKIIHVFLCCVS